MKEFIEFLLKQIVKNPEEVKVDELKSDFGYDYKINVSPDDMGLVIGKSGRTIKSLRALAKAKAIKDNVRINLEIVEVMNA